MVKKIKKPKLPVKPPTENSPAAAKPVAEQAEGGPVSPLKSQADALKAEQEAGKAAVAEAQAAMEKNHGKT